MPSTHQQQEIQRVQLGGRDRFGGRIISSRRIRE